MTYLADCGIKAVLFNEIINSIFPSFAGLKYETELRVNKEDEIIAKEHLININSAYLTENILKESGALLEGHFKLTSGRHSNKYIEKIKIIQNPEKVEIICGHLARILKEFECDVVIGPAYGAIVLGYEVAKQLGKQFAFCQRVDGEMNFRSGFTLRPGMKAIVIEDIVTTGGSVFEVIESLNKKEVEVVAVGLIVDRSGGSVDFNVPTYPLLTLSIESWEPEDCPLCKAGQEITKPGSSDKR
ncbi:MAG: orotate phosphoribosyltransferase [Candidatus Cloacimonetes bacterium]|nr:orotate phosphoribosyltransferase [Candidatus Cloacimonadota bacterium]